MKCKQIENLEVEEMTVLNMKNKEGLDALTFVLKESDKGISLIGEEPILETKTKFIEQDGTVYFVVMFRMNRNDSLIYGTTIESNTPFSQHCFDRFIFQPKIYFTIVNENNEVCSRFSSTNRLKKVLLNRNKKMFKLTPYSEQYHRNEEEWENSLDMFKSLAYI